MRSPIIFFAIFTLALSISGAEADPVGEKMTLTVFQSRTLTLPQPAKRVSVADPTVADIVVLSPTEYYLLGKDIGITNVVVWDRESGKRSTLEIEVTHDLESLRARIFRLIPSQSIEVSSAQRSIVLSGSVPSATAMTTALRVAESYLARVGAARKGGADDGASRRDGGAG